VAVGRGTVGSRRCARTGGPGTRRLFSTFFGARNLALKIIKSVEAAYFILVAKFGR
jgi:hypothetical protein